MHAQKSNADIEFDEQWWQKHPLEEIILLDGMQKHFPMREHASFSALNISIAIHKRTGRDIPPKKILERIEQLYTIDKLVSKFVTVQFAYDWFDSFVIIHTHIHIYIYIKPYAAHVSPPVPVIHRKKRFVYYEPPISVLDSIDQESKRVEEERGDDNDESDEGSGRSRSSSSCSSSVVTTAEMSDADTTSSSAQQTTRKRKRKRLSAGSGSSSTSKLMVGARRRVSRR